jgi:cytochrome c551/c552
VSKITESARGEICQIRLLATCNHNRDTTVWCHPAGSSSGKGIGMKAHDLLGAYGCSACHDVLDRRVGTELPRIVVENAFHEGHQRSILILIEKGIIRVERGTVVVQE